MFSSLRTSRQFLGFRVSPSRKGFAIYRATGLLLGTWGASYWITTRHIHLDSHSHESRDSEKTMTPNGTPESMSKSVLTQLKTLSTLSSYAPIDVSKRLNQHAVSVIPQSGAGVSRYDVVQVARCVGESFSWNCRLPVSVTTPQRMIILKPSSPSHLGSGHSLVSMTAIAVGKRVHGCARI